MSGYISTTLHNKYMYKSHFVFGIILLLTTVLIILSTSSKIKTNFLKKKNDKTNK